MRLDEESIRLEAGKFYRSLPIEAQEKIHSDDILAIFRSNRIYAVEQGKKVKSRTVIVLLVGVFLGYVLGLAVSDYVYAPAIGAILMAAIGSTVSERTGINKLKSDVANNLNASVASLLDSRL